MVTPDASLAFYRRQQRLSVLTVAAARRSWDRLGRGSWDAIVPQLALLVTAAQLNSARAGAAYAADVLDELNLDADPVARVIPGTLAGIASDGRDLAVLMSLPLRTTRYLINNGRTDSDALAVGRNSLDRIVQTQVADAGRSAVSVATAVRPKITVYTRMLNPPSCSRCAILAGRVYRWSAGFDRHPRCDCQMIPSTEDVAGDLRTDPLAAIKANQVTGISASDRRAIVEDGADLNQVLGARRGMSVAQVGKQKFKVTNAGRGGRGRKATRLRPESIYQLANGNRAESLRLLKLNGYIT